MRDIFFQKLIPAMEKDKNLFFLCGDTGYGLINPLLENFPERTLNVGVAEQNMIGIAAGLCKIGFRPICYAISNFLIYRCLEQIRNDICLHKHPIILVGTSTGFDNGGLGPTHHIIDEMGCLKSLPNISIYSPSSVESMNIIFEKIISHKEACYIRITKSVFEEKKSVSHFNRFVIEDKNTNILVITHGKMLQNSLVAHKMFPNFSIFAMDKIKPLEEKLLKELFKKYSKIVVIEDNFKTAGLYNSICQFVADKKMRNELYSISPKEEYAERIGDAEYLEEINGLSPEKIKEFIKK